MQEVKAIGSLEGKFESTNRIYDVGGCSPTLSTMQGGNQEPKILEEQIPCKLNKMPEGHLDSLDNAKICDVDTPTASTITSRYYKGIGAHKDNMCIVAMRGRNPDNPSDRTVGSPTEQRLEVNMQGTSNCLTSVQKDNLVLENVYDFYNDKIKQDGVCGTLTTGTAHNGSGTFGVVEGITTKGKHIDVASTILSGYERTNMTGFNADNGVVETINKVGQISNDGSQYGTVIADNGLSPNLVAGTHGYANSCIATQYRIRKLTPRECWRLMDFSDEDFEKAAEVNSNTQLYKQAGNSIICNVLVAILGQLIEGKEDAYRKV